MTLIGHVFDGKIVLGVPAPLPDGTVVRVETVEVADRAHDAGNPMIGLLADEPALADMIAESAMSARETRPLRTDRG